MVTLASYASEEPVARIRPHSCLIVGSDSAMLRAVGLILRGWGFPISYRREFTRVGHEHPHFLIADTDRNPSVIEEIHKLLGQGWRGKLVLFATPPNAITPHQRRQLGNVVVLPKPFRLAALFWAVGGREIRGDNGPHSPPCRNPRWYIRDN